ncbi:hypothetical protein [Paraburkholderia sp. EG304]|uniref:hypothetical protein n=1 Tax=Paraburkholderia sp. EG304 TaxID=3237015 RepID=UPI00397906A0
MTIVKNLRWVREITPTVITNSFLTAARRTLPEDSSTVQRTFPALIGLLDIFLRVTGQRLTMRLVGTERFDDIGRGFIGAIHCDTFLTVSDQERERLHSTWVRIAFELAVRRGKTCPLPPPTTLRFWSWELCDCVRFFRTLPINDEEARKLQIWTVRNIHGEERRLKLDGLRDRFGEGFATAYFEVADTYFSGRAQDSVEHINHIAAFLASYPDITLERLHDDKYCISLWSDFLTYYIETRIKTARIDTIAVSWRNEVHNFLVRHLFKSGLASKPSTLIDLPLKKASGHPKHIVEDSTGLLYTEKLLTAIPLQLTDHEAIEVLFGRIERSVSIITNWAERERTRIVTALKNRKKWEKAGDHGRATGGSPYLVSRKNPAHLINASATIAYFGGYVTRYDWPALVELLPSGLRQLALELGFPTAQSLLPFATILVQEHSQITPAMLEQLEIFDEKGRLANFFEDDEGWMLRCAKMRRGPVHAEEYIRLNKRSAAVIIEILALTDAPRKYLKQRANPDWRYLFITTGSAFGFPRRLKDFSTCTSMPNRVDNLIASFESSCELPHAQVEDLVRCFSLPALRASIGVLEYIKTCSAEKMAAKLGHHVYDASLLSHYLPDAIRNFLRVRYVRIMQTGIIVEAMKSSPYQLEASGFSSAEELSKFLNAHTIRYTRNHPPVKGLIDGKPIAENIETEYTHVAFNISVDVLTVYTSIAAALSDSKRTPTATAVFWNNIGRRLVAYIDEKRTAEPEHWEMLNLARNYTNPDLVSHIVYGQA